MAFILTPLVRWLAYRLKLVDEPDGDRKFHDKPVPRVGGIAIAIAFFVPILGLFFIDNGVSEAYLANPNQVFGLIGGSIFTIALGLWDDVKGCAPALSLLEVGLAVGVFFLDYRIDSISHPFGKFRIDISHYPSP